MWERLSLPQLGHPGPPRLSHHSFCFLSSLVSYWLVWLINEIDCNMIKCVWNASTDYMLTIYHILIEIAPYLCMWRILFIYLFEIILLCSLKIFKSAFEYVMIPNLLIRWCWQLQYSDSSCGWHDSKLQCFTLTLLQQMKGECEKGYFQVVSSKHIVSGCIVVLHVVMVQQ